MWASEGEGRKSGGTSEGHSPCGRVKVRAGSLEGHQRAIHRVGE